MGDAGGEVKMVAVEDFNKEVEKRQRTEAELIDAKKKLDSFKDIDPVEHKANKEALERLEKEKISGDPAKLEEWQRTKEEELNKRYGKKYDELEGQNKDLRSEISGLKVTSPAMQKAASLFVKEEQDTVRIYVERDLYLLEGKICVRGADGKPLASIKNPREDMGLDEYLEQLAEKHPTWALPTQKGGAKQGGRQEPGNGGGDDRLPGNWSQMSQGERTKWFGEHPEARKRFLATGQI